MDAFIAQQQEWNLKKTQGTLVAVKNQLYTHFLEEFQADMTNIETHLFYHFLFSSPNIISIHAKSRMIQWMEMIRQKDFLSANLRFRVNEQSLNRHVLKLNQLAHRVILFYFLSLCIEYPQYSIFLEKEVHKLYTRLNTLEDILWKRFLYPHGDPEYVVDYHPTI